MEINNKAKFNKEQYLKDLDKALEELPKTQEMVSSFVSINVDDLKDAVDRFSYVPSYQDLLQENRKLKDTLCNSNFVSIQKYDKLLNKYEQLQLSYSTIKDFKKLFETSEARNRNARKYVKAKARNNCWIDQYDANELIQILDGKKVPAIYVGDEADAN